MVMTLFGQISETGQILPKTPQNKPHTAKLKLFLCFEAFLPEIDKKFS